MRDKQDRFCQEYLIDLNATRAAIRAGYSPKTARQIGQENLSKPDVQARICELKEARAKRTEITQDRVLLEIAALAFSDIGDIVDWDEKEVRLIPSSQIPPNALKAVKHIRGDQSGVGVTLYDKVRALDMLARHLGLYDGAKEKAAPQQHLKALAVIMEARRQQHEEEKRVKA